MSEVRSDKISGRLGQDLEDTRVISDKISDQYSQDLEDTRMRSDKKARLQANEARFWRVPSSRIRMLCEKRSGTWFFIDFGGIVQ